MYTVSFVLCVGDFSLVVVDVCVVVVSMMEKLGKSTDTSVI